MRELQLRIRDTAIKRQARVEQQVFVQKQNLQLEKDRVHAVCGGPAVLGGGAVPHGHAVTEAAVDVIAELSLDVEMGQGRKQTAFWSLQGVALAESKLKMKGGRSSDPFNSSVRANCETKRRRVEFEYVSPLTSRCRWGGG